MFNRKDNKEETGVVEDSRTKLQKAEEENKELYPKLTKKNRDYMFQLDRRLDELNYDHAKKVIVINQMLNEIVQFQEDAITARRMYGTVTERADKILGLDVQTKEEEKSPTWMLYVDGALLLGGLFGLVNGISAWREPEINVTLLQLVMNFLLGGLAVLTLTKYRPEPGKTKGMFKYILATVGVMLVWVFWMSVVQLIAPVALNPVVPPFLVMGIGIAGILARWYFKRKYDIQGTLF